MSTKQLGMSSNFSEGNTLKIGRDTSVDSAFRHCFIFSHTFLRALTKPDNSKQIIDQIP